MAVEEFNDPDRRSAIHCPLPTILFVLIRGFAEPCAYSPTSCTIEPRLYGYCSRTPKCASSPVGVGAVYPETTAPVSAAYRQPS